ncbi:MAG: hypothetical protein H6744_05445 [Deltaproteobacteria bacterium]|nr:hypothetical protein [Deltaproteobacteria bacterium]MCB9786123.1 hypothetical protein [Deltaproteobacteria bacterium]
MGILDRIRRGRGDGTPPPWRYPLERTQDRQYANGYAGDLYVWDIDKTYLATDMHSLGAVLRIPLERGIDKQNIAGTEILLRALRRGAATGGSFRSNPLYFVSASPPQLRAVLERKMVLDGVEFDGITFKDQLALMRLRRVHKLTAQVGYKLAALLLNRRELPWTVRETLFGDDSESDAFIYAVYADIVAGRLRGERLVRTLRRNHVDIEDSAYIDELSADLPAAELVHRVYINLETRTPPARFEGYGPRLVPCYDSFQMALHLVQDRKIAAQAALDVGRALLDRPERQPLGLLRSAFDLVERGVLSLATLRELWPDLHRRHLLPTWVALSDEAGPPLLSLSDPPGFLTPAELLAPE